MPARKNIPSLLTKYLGKEAADAMVAKIDEMIRAKKSAAQIEKRIIADLNTHIAKQKEVVASLCAEFSEPVAIDDVLHPVAPCKDRK